MLVGNKKDIRLDIDVIFCLVDSNLKPLKMEDGRAMAQNIGAFSYVECSAKLNEGVKEVFDMAFRAIFWENKHKSKHT